MFHQVLACLFSSVHALSIDTESAFRQDVVNDGGHWLLVESFKSLKTK